MASRTDSRTLSPDAARDLLRAMLSSGLAWRYREQRVGAEQSRRELTRDDRSEVRDVD